MNTIIVSGVTDESSMVAKELKVFICFFCEERFDDKHRLTRHQDTCSMRSYGLQTLFKDLSLPRQQEHREPDHSRSRKRNFLECFKIISIGRAEALGRRDGGEQIVCDVIVLDESDEDDAEVELQPRPASPRRLIPCDGKSFKRSSSVYQNTERKNAVVVNRDNDAITKSCRADKLLRIDICSPLGQRLRDHVHTLNSSRCEPYDKSQNGMNGHCPSSSLISDSPFYDRLRQPSDYRITFRPTRQQCRSYFHAYKFTSKQRGEFCRAFDCGLSVRARRLLRCMKPCRVQVSKLPSTMPKEECSNIRELELTSNHKQILPRIRPSVVSVTRCDYQVTGGSMSDASRCDVNTSETINSQMASDLSSSECNTQETTVVHPTPDINQCRFDSEAFATVTSTSLVTGNEIGVDLSQQLLRVSSTANATYDLTTEKSDLLLVNRANVCDDSNENTEASTDTCVDDFNAGVRPTTSVNSMKTVVPTANKDSETTDCCTDRDSSMEEMLKTMTNTSGWSMSGDLPALSFFCNICGIVVDCERDAKSLIFDHYASHGITNIELMDETTPSGEKVLKLIELPTEKANNAKTTHSQATSLSTAVDRKSANNSVLAQSPSSQLEGVEFGISCSTPAVDTQKKRRRVTWADEVCNTTTQQPLHKLSPVCLDAAHEDTGLGSSKRRLTSYPSQQTMLLNNDSVTSALCSGNNVTIPAVAAFTTELSAVGSNLSDNAVNKSTPHSFPLARRSATTSNAIRCRNKTAYERAKMFWSKSSLGGTASVGGPSAEAERPYASRTQVSTALHSRSKRAEDDAMLSLSVLGGAWDRCTGGVCRSRKSLPLSSYTPLSAGYSMPVSHMVSTADEITLNNIVQSHQQETDVICID